MKIKPIKKISHNDSVITVIEGDYVEKKKSARSGSIYKRSEWIRKETV